MYSLQIDFPEHFSGIKLGFILISKNESESSEYNSMITKLNNNLKIGYFIFLMIFWRAIQILVNRLQNYP